MSLRRCAACSHISTDVLILSRESEADAAIPVLPHNARPGSCRKGSDADGGKGACFERGPQPAAIQASREADTPGCLVVIAKTIEASDVTSERAKAGRGLVVSAAAAFLDRRTSATKRFSAAWASISWRRYS